MNTFLSGCSKIREVLKELETIGLIHRKRNGRGKANYIYVMDYMAIYRKDCADAKEGEDSESILSPELLNEVQREAGRRMNGKEIQEQTMSRENAKVLREQRMDKRMEQEAER